MTLFALLESSPALWFGVVGLCGLFVGSFLNVVIHRLPLMMERDWRAGLAELAAEGDAAGIGTRIVTSGNGHGGERGDGGGGATDEATGGATGGATDGASIADEAPFNLAVPRSRCPACGTPIAAWQNVPILSWLALRGRCARCAAPISVRYPLVEAATMVLSLLVAWHFGPSPQAVLAIVVTWFLVAMTMIDIDHQLLPDTLTLPLMWIGLLAALLPVFADTRAAIIGAAAGYLVLWSVYQLFRLVTGKEGMGYGDFKLLAALGALLGWQMLPMIILLSSLVGAVVGLTLIAVTGRGKDVPIPFGPYLAAAGWIAMLWGETLSTGYLALIG